MSDLERELEMELHRALDSVASMPIPARRAVQSRGPIKALLGGAGAALTVKILTGVAVAAAAVTVAGAATTGSLNPTVWGQQVKQQVDTCRDAMAHGGIGDCVSGFANQHGQTVASDARHHGNDNGNSNGSKDKDQNGNPTEKSSGSGNGGSDGNGSKNKPVEPAGEPTDPADHPPVHVTPGP